MPPLMESQKLGRYEIVAELGKGAMGTVYKAVDPLLNRTVAIKTINMSVDQDEMAEYEARFYQEAKAAGGLNHPNIVTVYDIGRSGNVAYMAMELLEGRELRSMMTPGIPRPVGEAVDVAAQVAEGLAYAHHHEVVHRDIKPANIMVVRDGLAKITDFGIARMRTAEVRTQTGVLLGSPKYMSPEQVLGKRAEPDSDIFSLGVVLYEMLTGKAPFTGADVNAIMFQIVNLVPPAPSSINPGVPTMLDFITAKALAKTAQARYTSAKQLAADLQNCKSQIRSAPAHATVSSTAERPAFGKIDAEAATRLLAQSYPHSRLDDGESAAFEIAATQGLSKAFDSSAATLRLAVQTGETADTEGIVKTQKVQTAEVTNVRGAVVGGTLSQQIAPSFGPRHDGWGPRDKWIFSISVTAALLLAAVIALV
jgi:serine/threonine-protein kinase